MVMVFRATEPIGAFGQMLWRELGEKEREEYITKAEKVRAGDRCAHALTYRHTHPPPPLPTVTRKGGRSGRRYKGLGFKLSSSDPQVFIPQCQVGGL